MHRIIADIINLKLYAKSFQMGIHFFTLLFHVLLLGIRQDSSLVLPIRQTASIFKQPVTVIRNHPDSRTRTDLKHGSQEPPRQVSV